jgi:hypothetical protein
MPSSKTHCRSTRSFLILCGSRKRVSVGCAGVVRTSSLGVPKDRPSTDMKARRPLPEWHPKMLLFRHEVATPRARAALVVSHDFDGLLRRVPAGLLHPATGHGVRHVSGPLAPGLHCPTLPLDRGALSLTRLSRGASPCEAFPSSPALRCVTTADTFSPLPSVFAACAAMLPPPC